GDAGGHDSLQTRLVSPRRGCVRPAMERRAWSDESAGRSPRPRLPAPLGRGTSPPRPARSRTGRQWAGLNIRPYAALEMRRRGWTTEQIDSVIYQNPIRFMGQSPKFKAPAGLMAALI